jgi:hypothetical protein
MAYSYNIYYSARPKGPWTLANSTPIESSAYGNSYTISGLRPGVTYWLCVAGIDENNIEGPKSIPWAIKTLKS